MEEIIVETKELYKEYRGTEILKDINIKIENSNVYALIGKNGAGKTSFIRILAGLAFKTKGYIEIFGKSEINEISIERNRIGYLIEGPTLYENMTAYENLETERICRGIPNKENISESIKLVGLEESINKKVKHFSLGMKQRLGIAMALMCNPDLLILDEPTNGLDPMGIVEMRNLIRKLNEENNITIIISSHLLTELYQIATNYIIINNGQIVENLTLEELDEKCQKHISLKVDNLELTTTILESELGITDFVIMEDGVIKIYNSLERIEIISRELSIKGVVITQIDIKGDSLEEYFLKLIGDGKND